MSYQKLDAMALALAGGILWGLTVFFTAILGMYWLGVEPLSHILSMYPGYESTWTGAFIGLAFGFLDAFIGSYIFAWLYNK